MCIAQEILDNYFQLKKALMASRNRYLKEKVRREKDGQYYNQLRMRSEHASSSQKILATKKQKLLKHSRDVQQLAADHHAYFRQKKEARAQSARSPPPCDFKSATVDRAGREPQRHTLFDEPVTKKQFLHKVHPPSKLLLEKTKASLVDDRAPSSSPGSPSSARTAPGPSAAEAAS